jgi:hypothetical protein
MTRSAERRRADFRTTGGSWTRCGAEDPLGGGAPRRQPTGGELPGQSAATQTESKKALMLDSSGSHPHLVLSRSADRKDVACATSGGSGPRSTRRA